MLPTAYSPGSEVLAPTLNQSAQALPGGGAALPVSTNVHALQAAQAAGMTVNLAAPT